MRGLFADFRSRTIAVATVAMLVLVLIPPVIFAQDRGLAEVAQAIGGEEVVIGRQYAVLIAIDRYEQWTPLRNPVSDAREVKEILDRRYYIDEFIELYDEEATAVGIRRLFGDLIDTVGPDDSVFVYYAGHGYTDRFETGFWIPVDGGSDVEAQERWIPNQQIRNFLSQMNARSVALFADSCFSGDLLNVHRGAPPAVDSEYFRNALTYRARQVLTSGASESVPDESEFSRQLKLFLESNTEPYVDPYAIYDRVRRGVSETLPLLGTLPGQETGGSFVLFLRDTVAVAARPGSAESGPQSRTGVGELMVNLTGGFETAEILINGDPAGTAPTLLQKLPAGVPLVVEAKSGYHAARAEVTLKPDELAELSLTLERMQGNLYIEANETDVELYLDGERIGPFGTGLFRDLAAGERTIELKGSDLYYRGSVTILGNETARLSARVVGLGSLRVDVPEGVTVRVSGNGLSRTLSGAGSIGELPEGVYSVSSSGDGFQAASGRLRVSRGRTASWVPYTTGTVRFEPSVRDATVSINGRSGGVVPSSLDLDPGTYNFRFSAPGFHETEATLEVVPGSVQALSVELDEFERGRVEIPEPPFGVRLSVAGADARKTGASLVADDVRTGVEVPVSVEVPFADSVDPSVARGELLLDEGAHRTLDLPSGTFEVPWVPDGAALRFARRYVEIPLEVAGLVIRSPPLVPGEYTVDLTGPYEFSTRVTVKAGETVELPGYREALRAAISNERAQAEALLESRKRRDVGGWVSLGGGVVGSAVATVAYFLGAEAREAYDSAVATVDVLDARSRVELWGTVLPAAAAVGGAGFGLAPILFSAGPDPDAVRDDIRKATESLARLAGE